MKYYRILSPDGFDINRHKCLYRKKEVLLEVESFVKRFESQGYYSSCEGRIELNDLMKYIEVQTVKCSPKDYLEFNS